MRRRKPDVADAFLVHQDALRRLALALDACSADDLLQETWIQSASHAPPDHIPVGSWLRGVLRNIWRMHRRTGTRRTQRERNGHLVATAGDPPDVALERSQQLEQLRRMVAELRPPLRAVVEMRYYEGLSAAEISRREGIPAGTVRRRLKDALDQLRAHEGSSLLAVAPFAALSEPPVADLSTLGHVVAVKTSTKLGIAAVVAAAFVGGGITGRALAPPQASGPVVTEDDRYGAAASHDSEASVRRPRHQVDPANHGRVRELEDRITMLESELSALRTKLSITESSQPLTRTFFNLTDEEKAALVDNCEIRSDLPRPMSQAIALDLDLSERESAAWDRAWTRYDAARQAEMVELWEQLTGDRLRRIELLAIPPEQLQEIRAEADPRLLRVLAEERAGMRSPPPPAEYAALPPADRWVRLNVLQGNEFERYLAKELGPSRARELRSATDGWPGGRMHREGCAERVE